MGGESGETNGRNATRSKRRKWENYQYPTAFSCLPAAFTFIRHQLSAYETGIYH